MERFVIEIERTYGKLLNNRMYRHLRKLNRLPKFKVRLCVNAKFSLLLLIYCQ